VAHYELEMTIECDGLTEATYGWEVGGAVTVDSTQVGGGRHLSHTPLVHLLHLSHTPLVHLFAHS
jgi:hypothetical protein